MAFLQMYRCYTGRTALCSALLAACGSAAGGEERLLPAGTWGGDHVLLEVAADGAAVELDCAHGRVEGPIRLDADGRFEAAGSYVRERGGPAREDGEDALPARYAGRVERQRMTLAITLAESGEALGTFTLTRGRTPRLTKCL